MAQHWAASLIGEAWTPVHNCWWLVEHYFRERHGVAMPRVEVGSLSGQVLDNVGSIKQAAQASGWRPVAAKPRADDVLLMRGPMQRRHVGVMVEADGRLGLLHSDGCMTAHGPRGGVVWQTLAEATADGYGTFEVWRHAA